MNFNHTVVVTIVQTNQSPIQNIVTPCNRHVKQNRKLLPTTFATSA